MEQNVLKLFEALMDGRLGDMQTLPEPKENGRFIIC